MTKDQWKNCFRYSDDYEKFRLLRMVEFYDINTDEFIMVTRTYKFMCDVLSSTRQIREIWVYFLYKIHVVKQKITR